MVTGNRRFYLPMVEIWHLASYAWIAYLNGTVLYRHKINLVWRNYSLDRAIVWDNVVMPAMVLA